ncbi:MAG: PEP-CTERM sorting domain-containing protein [Opitutales bacterium]|nr:PEP-CTERM sorting domain-containing protein [Opitutales bacterium]
MKSNTSSSGILRGSFIAIATACLLPSAQAQLLANWEFNEPAGTGLTQTVDSVNGLVFNGGITGVATNGTGQLVFGANATFPDRYTLLPASALTTYELSFVVNSWDSSNLDSSAAGRRMYMGFYETTNLEGTFVGEVEFRFFDDGVDLRFVGGSGASVIQSNFAPALLNQPMRFTMTVDTAANVASLSYQIGMADPVSFLDLPLSVAASGREINYFGITSSQNFQTLSGAPLIESITITAIPEPSTYAAILGLAALAFLVWRRRAHRA